MKTVKLIDIIVTEVPYYNYNEVQYYQRVTNDFVPFNNGLIQCNEEIQGG